jgi:hypothetical protein
MTSYRPLSLETSSIKKKFHIHDDSIDFFEYYTLAYNSHFIYSHDATKIFTECYKNNPDIRPFALVYDKIKREYPQYKIFEIRIDDEKQKTVMKEYDQHQYKTVNTKTYMNDTSKKIVFIENHHNAFAGHYGVIFCDGKENYYFDSMLRKCDNRIQSGYWDAFTNAFYLFFGKQSIQIDEAYYNQPYTSFEIVGGEVSVTNPYVDISNPSYFIQQTFLGVDTQNPYCFMWGMMYAMIRLVCEDDTENMLLMINENSITPICLIKYFSSFVIAMLNVYDPEESEKVNQQRLKTYKTLSDPRFSVFFNTFISNSSRYDECFEYFECFDTYNMFENEIGKNALSASHLSIQDIVDQLYGFCMNPTYRIVDMSHPNKKVKVSHSYEEIHDFVLSYDPKDNRTLDEIANGEMTRYVRLL